MDQKKLERLEKKYSSYSFKPEKKQMGMGPRRGGGGPMGRGMGGPGMGGRRPF